MAEESKTRHVVRHWLGTLESYNKIKEAKLLDDWTRYTVKVIVDGSVDGGASGYVEYYGQNRLTPYYPGELLPVKDVVKTLPTDLLPGDRYLVGPSGAFDTETGKLLYEDDQKVDDKELKSWWIVTIQGKENNGYLELIEPDIKQLSNLSVRVESQGLKAYVLVNGKLKTYDDVDCGTF